MKKLHRMCFYFKFKKNSTPPFKFIVLIHIKNMCILKSQFFSVSGKLDEKASQLHAIASLRVLLDAAKANGGYPSGSVSVAPPGGCCPSCASCPQCVTCPTCQRPLRPVGGPAQDPSNPVTLNSYLVTANEGPMIYPSNPSVGSGISASGAKRQVVPQGQDPLTNVHNLQVCYS